MTASRIEHVKGSMQHVLMPHYESMRSHQCPMQRKARHVRTLPRIVRTMAYVSRCECSHGDECCSRSASSTRSAVTSTASGTGPRARHKFTRRKPVHAMHASTRAREYKRLYARVYARSYMRSPMQGRAQLSDTTSIDESTDQTHGSHGWAHRRRARVDRRERRAWRTHRAIHPTTARM